MPMRLRSDVNGNTSRMSYTNVPRSPDSVIECWSRAARCTPIERVQSTSATSSGLDAWYVTLPSSFVTGVTLWHRASAMTMSYTLALISRQVRVRRTSLRMAS